MSERKPHCSVSRQWGNGRTAWRCNLDPGHDGKHYDPVRQMYWGDVVIMSKGRIR
jgi:hypothetical protein